MSEEHKNHLHESVIVYALRYALRRPTGALLQILMYIKSVNFKFTEQTKEDILREIEFSKIHHPEAIDFIADELKDYITKI